MTRTIDLSPPPSTLRRFWFAAFWALPATLFGLILWHQEGVPFRSALAHSFVDLYTLAALSIPVDRASRWIRASGRSPGFRAVAHLVLAVLTIGCWKSVLALYLYSQLGSSFWRIAFEPAWLYQLSNACLIYAVLLSAIFVLHARQREEQRALREAALAITAREAQLSSLRAHLQPHFVFNALTAAMALVESDPPVARVLMEKLADVLRQAFTRLEKPFVALGDELAFIESYLAVERMRFGPRLHVEVKASPDLREVRVPPLILQPLVENAVKHGVSTRGGGSSVVIEAERKGPGLRLRVRDTGVRRGDSRNQEALEPSSGQGLTLIRRRLEAIYPGRHTFTFGGDGDGFAAEMTVPAETDGD